jgi:hypothetical protein
MAVANSEMGEYAKYAEITRITQLPVIAPLNIEMLEEVNRTHLLAEAYMSGFRLFDIQANGIWQYEQFGGVFGPIGVGWGKTLLAYLITGAGYKKGLRKIVYFCPPNVFGQVSETDLIWARSRVPILFPVHKLGRKDSKQRRNLAKSNKPGLYIFPYSLLSTADAEELLWFIAPELCIFDECHQIRHRSTARTKRVQRYVTDRKPECVDLSGTITSKSVMDYHHLIGAALGKNSPLPLSTSLANEWAAVVDANAEEERSATGPLVPLIQWARSNFPHIAIPDDRSGFRTAFKIRMSTCPGVVASGDADIGVSLVFENKPIENYEQTVNWKFLEKLTTQVIEMWLTPNGDEIEHAIHTWKWLYELSCGFYNQLTWPSVEEFAIRKSISLQHAQTILERAVQHHATHQDYAKSLREWLQGPHQPGLDTPFLVGQEMARNGGRNVAADVYDRWAYMKSLDFEGRPDRDRTAIRICDFKINDACVWAMNEIPKGEGGIIWIYHQAVGLWLYEYLSHYGANVLHCPAGEQHNDTIRDTSNANKIIVASVTAHCEGKNLQHFQNQYVLQWPRSASKAEQMVGRTHRNGQEADELVVRTCNTLEWDDLNFAACLNDALYIHQTTGNRQKLIYGSYSPMPKIYSSSFLIERGLETNRLDSKQQQLLNEKFGEIA